MTELGPGWAPAFLETQREIDLIRAAEERFFSTANGDEYWISGTVNLNPDDYFPSCSFDATRSGKSIPRLSELCMFHAFFQHVHF